MNRYIDTRKVLEGLHVIRKASPYKIAWVAIGKDNTVKMGASKTRRTVNDLKRAGYDTYVL